MAIATVLTGTMGNYWSFLHHCLNGLRAAFSNRRATALYDRFERTGILGDIHQAIAAAQRTVELTSNENPNRFAYLNNLGIALMRRFERTGSMEDLDHAIEKKEQAVKAAPVDHPDCSMYLRNLGNALQRRFERTGSMEDLNRAIEKHRQAVECVPLDHPKRAMRLNDLGSTLLSRFERTGSMDDLDNAIEKTEQALVSIPVDHPNYAGGLNNLGKALQRRFERTGSVQDLDRAIEMKEQAVESTPLDLPDRALYLSNLGNALQRRSERTGSMPDLDRAIEKKGQAVDSSPPDHPDHAMYLNNLGSALQQRFKRTGSKEDLDHAIKKIEQAVESIPVDHPRRAMYLNNLGSALQSRFETIGSMEDLDRAIEKKTQAVESTPLDHRNYEGRLDDLANALQRRFDRTGLIQDLDHAIEKHEQAVEFTPLDHPDRAISLNNLGSALHHRFKRTGLIEDLDCAIDKNKQAVESIPMDHPNHAVGLNNLGNALQSRFERTGSMQDLDRAIENNEQAVESTPAGHPDRAMYLHNLGLALEKRFKWTRSMDDLDRSIATYEQAANCNTAPPSTRLRAAGACADLLIRQQMLTRAKPILETAVRLLPTLSPRQLKRNDAQFNISQFANLTASAVSLCLENMDDPYKSLQLLELGRGILANLQLEVRSDISVLEADHPALAQQFQLLRDQIDSPSRAYESKIIEGRSANSPPISSNFISNRQMLFNRFDDLLAHIRSLPSFENFLQGPSEVELRSLAKGGAIVVFNMSDVRSDAFLITTDQIHSVHLPLLTSWSVTRLAALFFSAIHEDDPSRYRHATRKMNIVLQELWDRGVKTILDKLEFSQPPPPGQTWPRIWWVGSGLLSVLPIHAAGYHDSNPPESALDRVVSSYAFTVKSLAYARERAAKVEKLGTNTNAILFGMPTTPDEMDLPFVEKEINDIRHVLEKASIPTLTEMNPVRVDALSKLSTHAIAHFSCHGCSESDPSQSSLLLQDWKNTRLTVLDLVSLNIEPAKFAYLSACHTSAMRDVHLLDESINLSSAIQLCGYPAVVGSLWQVRDNSSADIARWVYEWILEGGGSRFDARRSAEGLHKAARQLREKTRIMRKHDALIWAPFIHVGI